MKVSELGEFGLIERLAELLAAHGQGFSDRLAVGIGDDAAVWSGDGGAVIATTDTLVQDVHFLSGRTAWRDLGWKVLAVNVSDVVAMGGEPDFALVTLALPPDVEAEAVDDLYRGLAEACEAFGATIAGGDVVRAPVTVVTCALTGRAGLDAAGEPLVLRRNAAREGDLLAVTGALGGAAGGLRALRAGDDDPANPLLQRHLRPRPRLAAGPAAVAAGLRCAIDVSDGLLQDLGHVCRASRLAAVVWADKLPVDPALADAVEPDEALRLAATGGEDYELLVAGPRERIEALGAAIDVPLTVVGEMVIEAEHSARLLDQSGRAIDVDVTGWDHLRG